MENSFKVSNDSPTPVFEIFEDGSAAYYPDGEKVMITDDNMKKAMKFLKKHVDFEQFQATVNLITVTPKK